MDLIKTERCNEERILRSADLEIHLRTQQVFHQGRLIPLKGLSYRLLETLVQANPQLVSPAELALRIWRKAYVSDETIAQRVSLLRKALSFLQVDTIESVRSEGYRWLPAVTTERSHQSDIRHNTVPALRDSTKRKYMLAVVILPCIVALAYYIAVQPSAKIASVGELHPRPVMLQKAVDYAQQNHASANAIAIELFSKFLMQQPDHIEALLGLATANIERVVKFNGDAQLLDVADKQIKRLATTAVAPWRLAKLTGYYHDARGDIAKAIAYYEQALAADRDAMRQVAASLAYLYVRKGRLYEAMQLNLSVLNHQHGYSVLQVAEILYLAGLSGQASTWVGQAYQLAPHDAFVAVQYARDAKGRGDKAGAYQALHKLHQFHAGTADSYITLALLAIDDQQWELAGQALASAEQREPDSLYASALLYWLVQKKHLKGPAVRPTTDSNTAVWPNWHVAKSIVEIADADFASAKNSLAAAVSDGFIDLQYLLSVPIFTEMADDIEFQELLRQMRHSVNTERAKIMTIELPEPTAVVLAE